MEKFNINIDDRVERELQDELNTLGKEVEKDAFFDKKEDGTKAVNMENVNAFLETIKSQSWSDIIDQKQDRLWVSAVQIKLSSLGYNLGVKGVDGWFGNATKSAIQKFQKDQKFAQEACDGLPGKETIKALLKAKPKSVEEKKNNDKIQLNKESAQKTWNQTNIANEKNIEQNEETIIKELELRDISSALKEGERNFFWLPKNEKIYMRKWFDGYYFFNEEKHLTFIPDLRQSRREHWFFQQIYLNKEWKISELPESKNLEEALKRHLFDSLERYWEKYKYKLNYNKDKKHYELISNDYRIPINLSVLRGSGELWEKNTFIGNRLQTLLLLAKWLKLAKGQEGEFIVTNLKNNPSIKGISFKKSPKHYNELIHPDRMQKKYPFLTWNAIKSCVDWLNKNHKTA